MKLLTYTTGTEPRFGAAIERDGLMGVIDLSSADSRLPPTLDAYLAEACAGRAVIERALARSDGPFLALASVRLLPPVTRPSKVLCIGLNYRDHAAEVKLDLPTSPTVFAKFASTLVGEGAAIVIPKQSHQVDYEAELAFVIGRRAHHVSESDAYAYIAGYTIFNDVSVRDVQMRTSQWTLGKAFDTHGPIGPWIVTPDEIPDPHVLGIRLRIGDELLQNSSTSQLVFGIPRLIAELSAVMTLEPGDIVATGTPAGVGFIKKPPRYLRAGERVRVEIDGIGALENPVTAES